MTQPPLFRVIVILAGAMGAIGVALAAAAAHLAGGRILASASSMLLFHALAALAALLLVERHLVHRRIGLAAALGFIAGAMLFGGDLTVLQLRGHSLFPMAAPTGGTLMIASWLVLALAAAWPRRLP